MNNTPVGLTKGITQPPANGSQVGVEGKDSEAKEDANEAYYRKRRIVLKIVVPVLISVAVILTLSALIVGLSACFCERNRRYVHVCVIMEEEMKGSPHFRGSWGRGGLCYNIHCMGNKSMKDYHNFRGYCSRIYTIVYHRQLSR